MRSIWLILFLLLQETLLLSKKKKGLQHKLFFSKLVNQQRNERSCSFVGSTLVYQILVQEFYPIYKRYGVEIPSKCPLQKARNIYNDFEKRKVKITSSQWKCDVCGKKFYAENYLNNHMIKKHGRLMNLDKEKICLAEYCDIFRCDLHEQYPATPNAFRECDHTHVLKLQRKCEKLMNLCLPTDMRHHVYDAVTKSLCSTLTCELFHIPFQDISVTTVVVCTLLCILLLAVVIYLLLTCWENWEDVEDREVKERQRTLQHLQARVAKGNRSQYSSSAHYRKRHK